MRRLSFIDLIAALRCRGAYVLEYRPGAGQFLNGKLVWINGIAREDGSGRKWIVTIAGDDIAQVGIYWDEERVPCPFFHVG